MPRNGSGVHSLPAGSLGVSGTTIESAKYNAAIEDLSSGLTDSLPRNGSAEATADIRLGGNKIVDLAAGSASGHAVEYAQMNTAIAASAADIASDIASEVATLNGSIIAASSTVRQTVLSGPTTSTGASDFGGTTGTTTVTATGTLLVHAAGGVSISANVNRTGTSTNPSWTTLSTNGTMYLYLDVATNGTCTPGSTTLTPIYQQGGTPSVANGQNTFIIREMKMYVGNGSTASQVYRVFVGEVTVASSVVSAIVWYALQGVYDSGWTSTLPSGGTTVSRNHNLGVHPVETRMIAECTTANQTYAVGEQIDPFMVQGSISYFTIRRTTTTMSIVGPGTGWFAQDSTGAPSSVFTNSSWKYKLIASRGF